ncbi:PHB depolymerase family esterase [Sphingomonas sp. H39-1-10]|uniref:PHB depolymerase family esterase n=1 Tax=Sphingomonas pollutisoli TaxID=3030829 RepID=UPI0023B90DF4|nr:PHB depolymerase family esterase [Sphingomonas pollutisoli]MDF0490347.1 PHB depolymerase family esterase [Sphingomonas pollutisoli]
MYHRRQFIALSTSAVLASGLPRIALAAEAVVPLSATAITDVFGHGLRLIGVALEYAQPIGGLALSRDDVSVEGRTVTNVLSSTTTNPADAAPSGRFVIILLDPEDEGARLYATHGREVVRAERAARVNISGRQIDTSTVNNLVVDDFRPLAFTDPQNGIVLKYNLFVPRDYDPSKRYPLVNFMHDASATSGIVDTTLIQGLGAVIWARAEEQTKRPCFVLAPQFDVAVVNDQSQATAHVDTVKRLIETLAADYPIDTGRLYTTGQSGGGMLSIAMNIKYPDFFAASLLVACQWDAALVGPMADDRLFIIVAEEDAKAYPGQNAITAELERLGARVNRAVWNGRWSAAEFDQACSAMIAEGAHVNYVMLKKGTVIPQGVDTGGAAGHMNTWPIAYTIDGVRAWLFAQAKT